MYQRFFKSLKLEAQIRPTGGDANWKDAETA